MASDQSKLKIQIPNQGWRQFLTARNEMLSAFDNARIHSEKKQVKVRHGIVAEAEFRKWLRNFLPKRYGVTAGYIISQGDPNSENLIHYDVIIYDRLESPVLWIDTSADFSGQGRSLAIPVEYVLAVFEVKSAFNKKSAKAAVQQLEKLKPFMAQVDPEEQLTKLYLPKNFFCATVFFELRKKDEQDFAALNELVKASALRGFYGGFILRAETLDQNSSGRLALLKQKFDVPPENDSLFHWSVSKCENDGNNQYFKILLTHSESYFSEFAFDIIALLKGNYNPNIMSSMYGFGTSQFEKGSMSDIRYYNPEDVKKYQEETEQALNNFRPPK